MIQTTVIGSYPVRLDGRHYADSYYQMSSSNASDDCLKQAVEKQIAAGIGIISDGQTRGDFVNIFAESFNGAIIQQRPIIISELVYTQSKLIDDLRQVKVTLPPEIKLKGIITGPFTLAKSSENRHYETLEDLSFAYARGLSRIAAQMSEIVDFVQVDEPYLSVDFQEYSEKLIKIVLKGVKVPKMLHVCGDVSNTFEKFIKYPVDYLEHEFAANPDLWNVVEGLDFKQTLGVGVVRSDSPEIETVEEIRKRIQKAIDVVGKDRFIVNPDCGLRNHEPDTAYAKLKNMVDAAKSFI